MMASDEYSLVSFKNKLALSGFNTDNDLVDQPYMFHHFEKYRVFSEEFPRIRRSLIHAAIVDGEYQLSIPALLQWKE